MKNYKKPNILITITILFLVIILYLIIDYCNLAHVVGLDLNRINYDVLGSFVGVLVAITIFYLTYCYVDQWNIRKHTNQREVAKMLLLKAYEECQNALDMLDKGALKILVSKTDFNAYYYRDSPGDRYSDIPFTNEALIAQMASEGVIQQDEYKDFLQIKQDVKQHISLSITFFDAVHLVRPARDSVLAEISKAIEKVNNN